ncbi:MAG: 3-oxoacyl-ACP synthase III [Planctomycetota bacterium]|nr:MAG: 3-oxoacyl-ACP synthase III [Planctomycetota bacterium]
MQLVFQNVAIESIGFTLPPQVVTSEEIERQLEDVYQRLRLPPGRLELMSGIAERRLWPPGTSIGGPSATSARRALEGAGLDPQQVGCLIHASVCRDYLEPATACRVHAELGLSSDCWVYDVSNACLGLLNGMVQIATLIESGAIRAGIVVGTENSRNLVESTIAFLNSNRDLTRKTIKPSFASLTIGSGSCAVLLVHRSLSRTENWMRAAVAQAECHHHRLCQSDTDQAGSGMQPLMQTDSEELLQAGVAVGAQTFERLLSSGLRREQIDASVCHQVGAAHRRLMLESLQLPSRRDIATFPWMGNTGSVALPTALAMGILAQRIHPQHQVALLGIGSGINSVMIHAEFNRPAAFGDLDANARMHLAHLTPDPDQQAIAGAAV